MNITNDNFKRVWKRSKESQLFNRWLTILFLLGFGTGIACMYFVYDNKINKLHSEIKALKEPQIRYR